MLENYDFDSLMEIALSKVPDDVDKREGSIIYDAIAGAMLAVSEVVADVVDLFSDISLVSCEDNFLDVWGGIARVTRKEPTKSEYKFIFTGVDNIDDDIVFIVDDTDFVVKNGNDETYPRLVALEGSSDTNDYESGTIAVPENTIDNLESAEIGELLVYGDDGEEDLDYYNRLKTKLSEPERNNNSAQVKKWAESVDGVYKAVTGKANNGKNQIYAFSAPYLEIGVDTKAKLQNYLDPGATGLGKGVADLGCCLEVSNFEFTAYTISISLKIRSGEDEEKIKADVKSAITDFLIIEFESSIDDLANSSDDLAEMTISQNRLMSEIFKISSIKDVTEFKITDTSLNTVSVLKSDFLNGNCFRISEINVDITH